MEEGYSDEGGRERKREGGIVNYVCPAHPVLYYGAGYFSCSFLSIVSWVRDYVLLAGRIRSFGSPESGSG